MSSDSAASPPVNLRNVATANLARPSNTLKETARDLVRSGSLEIGADRPSDALAIAELLPAGTPVFVNHLPKNTLSETLSGLKAVRSAGLEPVPHVAARRIQSRDELKHFLDAAVRDAGAKKLLLIGSDLRAPAGPFTDAQSVLGTGMIAAAGMREIAFAGHPEGHPHVDTAELTRALDTKIAMAREQGLGVSVITQFSFAPARILDFCAGLQRRHPSVPVYVGIPGPTSPAALLRFATICGVGASLRAMSNQGMGAIKLLAHTDPGEQLAVIAAHQRNNPHSNIVGVHLFSFARVAKTAAWMNGILRG